MLTALRAKFDVLLRKGFVRSVGVLVGGTAFAQALMVLVLPVLTRLYTPQDFSVFAVYASILGIISVAACLRLEIAIPIPERDEDAANLLALALCSSAVVAATVAIIVWLVPAQIVHVFDQPALGPYLWLLPLGIWLASSYGALLYWTARKKKFTAIAKTRMTQAIGGASTQMGLGWAGVAPFGLLLGHMISSGAGVFGLARDALKHDRAALSAVSGSGMRCTLRDYKRFPKYSTFEALANSAGIQVPVIIIAALAIGPEAGFLMLAMRAMQAPMGLIGGAVAQVYLARAPQELREDNLASFTAEVLGGLVKTGVGPLLFAGIVAPVVFPVIFGAEWHRAGELVSWLTPWLVVQFLVSPVSMSLHVTGSQRVALALQVFGLVGRVGVVFTAAQLANSWIVEAYALSSFIFYGFYLYVVALRSRIRLPHLASAIYSGLPMISLWVSAGVIARVAFVALGKS